jgi:hypothetical protein
MDKVKLNKEQPAFSYHRDWARQKSGRDIAPNREKSPNQKKQNEKG